MVRPRTFAPSLISSMPAPLIRIPVIYLRMLCDQLRQRGYDVLPWLAMADMSDVDIQRSDATVTLSQAERFILAIELGTQRQDWGYVVGREIKLTSHGAVGFAMVAGATLNEVIDVTSRYYRLANPLYTLTKTLERDVAVMRFRPTVSISPRVRAFNEEAIATSCYEQITPFFDSPPKLFEIHLRQRTPVHGGAYADMKKARFCFGANDEDGVSIYFDAAFLNTPNSLSAPATLALAEEICSRKIAELDKQCGWHEWVSAALRTADNVRPTQSELAKLLHISARTLERSLLREGTSFKEIYETVGYERACELLDDTRHSISDIAPRLGYSTVGAFSRAFKRRSGFTPSEYQARKRQRPNDVPASDTHNASAPPYSPPNP